VGAGGLACLLRIVAESRRPLSSLLVWGAEVEWRFFEVGTGAGGIVSWWVTRAVAFTDPGAIERNPQRLARREVSVRRVLQLSGVREAKGV
jgi:hypothetical protein